MKLTYEKKIEEYRDYAGVIHVHTAYSDGSGTLAEIIESAQANKLDFVIITDHNTIKAKEKGAEGWYNNTLVLVGEEITHSAGHCLVLNLPTSIHSNGKTPTEYLREINLKGGLSFIAHPNVKGKWLFGIPDASWKEGWNIPEFTGIELWSFLEDWMEDLNWFNLYWHIKYPQKAIDGPNKQTLIEYDKMIQKKQVVAIGVVDAHGSVFASLKILNMLPYWESFRTIRTHVLSPPFTKNFQQDVDLLYSSLAAGHCYVANEFFFNARGFSFKACLSNAKSEIKDNHEKIMGDIIHFTPGIRLKVEIPENVKNMELNTEIFLIHNGKIIKSSEENFEYEVKEKGTYRVEVYIGNFPWIFSNPIYII